MSMTHLLALQRLAEQHEPDLDAWLRQTRRRWREGEPLERAADLVGYGAVEAGKQALLAAAELLDPEHKLGAWRLAGTIARAFREFERRRWPVAQRLSEPDTLSALDRLFWAALVNSINVPRSQDRIFDLLAQRGWQRQSGPCSTPRPDNDS